MSDAILARKMWRTLEPYHSMIYFSAHASQAYEALGLPAPAGYFASRAAAFGPVPAQVVTATFFNFRPSLVEAVIPEAWSIASPAAIGEARLAAADTQLREILGPEVIDSPEMADAAALARVAAEGCAPQGRALFAAHASLSWPEEAHLVLWHAATLLREHRGDAHVAALVSAGLDPVETLITHGAAGDNLIPLAILKFTRGWTDQEWDAARGRLRGRGLLTDDDQLTDAGDEVRGGIERITDEQSLAPYLLLGADESDRLRALVRPFSRAIAASGVFQNTPAVRG